MATKAIPEGYDALIPYLVVRGASKAIEFYKELFGATELHRMPYPDNPNALAHAEIKIRNHVLMLGDENPQMNCLSPQALNGPSPVSIMIYVPDVDAVFKKASAMGVKVLTPPTDMFWGDRFSKFVDPFGHQWSLATHIKDVTPDEMAKAAQAAFAERRYDA